MNSLQKEIFAKNTLQHSIIEIIKTHPDPYDASALIIQLLENQTESQVLEDEAKKEGYISPIFRRIG